MPSSSNTTLRTAGILGFAGVALGAFGAHGLRARLGDEGMDIWKTAVLYHLIHAVALLAVAAAGERIARARLVTWLFGVGVVIFSGSLYLLAITGHRWLGAITPVGGIAFMAGWLVLAIGRPSRGR